MDSISNFVCCLPVEVICRGIFSHLSVDDLQALDTSFTNKFLRPHLRNLWKYYTYDAIGDVSFRLDHFDWLLSVGAQVVALVITHPVNDELNAMSLVAKTPNLRRYYNTNCVSNEMLMQLAQLCPHLEELRIDRGNYSDSGIRAVAQHCHQLHTISCYLAENALAYLCEYCPTLRNIHCSNLTDACVAAIASHYPHLQSITLRSEHNLTDAGLVSLANHCHGLQSLVIYYCENITSRGLAALWAANPNLTRFVIYHKEIVTDSVLSLLLQCCPRLRSLSLMSCYDVTDDGVVAVAEHYPQLESLVISSLLNISDDALIALGRHCHALKSIDISGMDDVSDVGILALVAGCPLLQEFKACFTSISRSCIVALSRGWRDLRSVHMKLCRSVGLYEVSTLVENCPMISELDFSGCDGFDDACLYVIAQHCRSLFSLILNHTNVSDTGAVRFVIASCRMLKVLKCKRCKYLTKSAKNTLQLLRTRLVVFDV